MIPENFYHEEKELGDKRKKRAVRPLHKLKKAGDPSTPEGTDFFQTTVPLDGNNDGTVCADIGAHEYDGPYPQPLAFPCNLKIEQYEVPIT